MPKERADDFHERTSEIMDLLDVYLKMLDCYRSRNGAPETNDTIPMPDFFRFRGTE